MKKLFNLLSKILPLRVEISEVQVCFSPRGGCTDTIVQQLNLASKTIRVRAYVLTSKPIAEALIAAHNRGVDVQVIIDGGGCFTRGSKVSELQNAGIPVLADSMHAIAHTKIIIVDAEIVTTGSFNFSNAAEYENAEDLLVIPSKKVAKIYLDQWKSHCQHSHPPKPTASLLLDTSDPELRP